MKNMEMTASAFSTASPIHLDCPAASCPFGNDANNGRTDSHVDSIHRGPRFPPVFSHNLCDEVGNCFTQPPIALLSRRRYQDPAVMRLHAALAFREMRSSANESPEPQASSSWTTNSAASPKNSVSIGYDDDAMSSSFSTPVNGSPINLFRRVKSLAFPLVRSSASLASGDEVNHVSSVVETTTKLKNYPFMNYYWNSRQPQQQQQQQQQGIEDVQEGLIETEKQEEIFKGVQTPCFIFDTMAGASQCTERGMSDSDAQFCGVPTDSSADVVAAWEMDDREGRSHDVDDDAALSHHEDDEVVGVTAEGNFIYRREIDTEGRRFCRVNFQHYEDDCFFPDECDDADTFPAFIPTAPFCTPERNIFATVLSDRAPVPNPHEERAGVWKNAAAVPSTASLKNRAAFPQGGSIGRNRQRKTPEWTPIDAEWCSLLLRYRVCENADETEYKELITAVNKWHEVRLRYPMEALERRLQEGESYDRPPFVLRW
ncbi:hypothetical protein MOQ_003292 [Trypanosoma cruzi marinkellei]|uniref:Uncharacterized protein n=1 Tax=Trypanosoma cruzi marinkellei TaxID=85056 RepID=K2MCB1_TRYCR|nr:hypothetical protein MOQ_003292 [Trypanosoma cruzi marinkellei]